ncbi:MAG: helix-turn-helix domain-containing protein [Phycisphaerae bacterium]|nr:helix-turn-helix domain-containing protein [Phycisphaerae bacterium]
MKPSESEKIAGRYAYDGLDRIIHEKARLSIIASLAGHSEGLLFNELKELCSLTDGNLSRHLAILQEADLVQMWKGTRNKRPQTLARLTEHGRRRFLEYVSRLERVVADASRLTGQSGAGAALRPRTT